MEFKALWDVESAMQVVADPGAESKLWAEAVEWLILHGPPEIKQMLLEASSAATAGSFPELEPSYITKGGKPCYRVSDLAENLGITETAVREILVEKSKEHDIDYLIEEDLPDSTVH
jgi:hypothetical protein